MIVYKSTSGIRLFSNFYTFYRSHSDSVPLLSAVDRYFTKLSDSQPGSDALSSVQLEKVLPFLQPNLSAPSSAVSVLRSRPSLAASRLTLRALCRRELRLELIGSVFYSVVTVLHLKCLLLPPSTLH